MSDIWVHDLDPVALDLGFFQIRWYALAYIVGLVAGWRWGMRLAENASPLAIRNDHIDRFLTWAVVGVIVGGRLGVVFFYHPDYYFADPVRILRVWEGGMSFHGGVLGVIAAMILFTRRARIPFYSLSDIVCTVAPIGIFLGRIANFINGEHWGRPADVPWAMIFPRSGDALPRHPSQLYEAGLEGVLLFLVLFIALKRFQSLSRPGLASGIFIFGYGLARMTGELFRAEEVFVDTLPLGLTWGQMLTIPMVLFGAYLIHRGMTNPPIADSVTAGNDAGTKPTKPTTKRKKRT